MSHCQGKNLSFKFEDSWNRLPAINCLTVQTATDTVGNEHNKLIFFWVALITSWGYDSWRVKLVILEVFQESCVFVDYTLEP